MPLGRHARRPGWPAATLALLGHACGPAQPGPRDAPGEPPAPAAPGWQLVYHEDFEDPAALGAPPAWAPAPYLFGDPHANFYEGQVHYDDLRLEVWRD